MISSSSTTSGSPAAGASARASSIPRPANPTPISSTSRPRNISAARSAWRMTRDNKEVINVQTDGSCAKKPRIFDTDSSYSFDATETEPPNTNSFFGHRRLCGVGQRQHRAQGPRLHHHRLRPRLRRLEMPRHEVSSDVGRRRIGVLGHSLAARARRMPKRIVDALGDAAEAKPQRARLRSRSSGRRLEGGTLACKRYA